jgi:hypothetical protein
MMSPLVRGLRRSAWLLALLAMVGCGVPWIVVKQSGPPSALKGINAVAVSFNYAGLMVAGMGGVDKPEAQWVAEKSAEEPNYQTTWAELKAKWESVYLEGLASQSPVPVTRSNGAPAPGNAADLTVTLTHLQVGKYMVVASKASTVNVTHTWSRNGQVVDEIRTNSAINPNLYQPSIFQHVGNMGKQSGAYGGKFLAKAQK